MGFLKSLFSKENLDWFLIILMIGICCIFGQNLLFTKVGFPAVCVMFGIAVVLSFLLRHVVIDSEDEEEPDT